MTFWAVALDLGGSFSASTKPTVIFIGLSLSLSPFSLFQSSLMNDKPYHDTHILPVPDSQTNNQ